ncbi:hypothetical protein ACSS6W_003487 [Trichoderma asperelloides]
MGDAHHIHVLDWAVPASTQQQQVVDGMETWAAVSSCLDPTPGADTEPVGRPKWPAGWGSVGSLVWDASGFAFCADVGARSSGRAS